MCGGNDLLISLKNRIKSIYPNCKQLVYAASVAFGFDLKP